MGPCRARPPLKSTAVINVPARSAPQFDGAAVKIQIVAGNCGGAAQESSNRNHSAAPLPAERRSEVRAARVSVECCGLYSVAAVRRRGSIMQGGLRWPKRPFQVMCALVAVVLTAGFSLSYGAPTHPGARPLPDKPYVGTIGERLNGNTIAIVSGNSNATYLTNAYDMSDVLDDGENFRIMPVIGKGGGQNIRDVRFLKGIDLGITQSIILNQ